MDKRMRFAAIGALAVVAVIVATALAQGDSGGRDTTLIAPIDDDAMAFVDRALGREPASVQVTADRAPAGAASSEAKPAAATSEGGGALPLSGLQDDRKIVQTASIRLQVREVGASFEEVGRIATASGGFVASSNFAYQGEQQVASVTIRVPASRYQEVLRELRSLAVKVDSEGSNASDVTEEFTDLGARLRTLEATEAQLLALLARANTITEVLQVQDRLNGVRTEIERVKGRINLLERLTEMATVTVHLRPAEAVAKSGAGVDLWREVSEAWRESIEFLAGIAAAVLSVLVFSWWVLVLAIPGAFALQRWLRTRPQPPAAATYD